MLGSWNGLAATYSSKSFWNFSIFAWKWNLMHSFAAFARCALKNIWYLPPSGPSRCPFPSHRLFSAVHYSFIEHCARMWHAHIHMLNQSAIIVCVAYSCCLVFPMQWFKLETLMCGRGRCRISNFMLIHSSHSHFPPPHRKLQFACVHGGRSRCPGFFSNPSHCPTAPASHVPPFLFKHTPPFPIIVLRPERRVQTGPCILCTYWWFFKILCFCEFYAKKKTTVH